MGYGVLPMAIEQDVMIAARKNDSLIIKIANVDQKYKLVSCNRFNYYNLNFDKFILII